MHPGLAHHKMRRSGFVFFALQIKATYWILQMATYSTAQVAEILGVGTDTLHRWMTQKKVAKPKLQLIGGVKVRLWSDAQLNAARKYKSEHYWGKGGRKNRKKLNN